MVFYSTHTTGNMERRFHNFDFDLDEGHQGLEQLILKARQRYMEVASAMAEHFLRQYQRAKFRMTGILRQTEVFEKESKGADCRGKDGLCLGRCLEVRDGP